jgi:hypothetical protein
LPVTSYHRVFTRPHELNEGVEWHPEGIYPLRFQSVWTTREAFGRDPKRLNGTLGVTWVLHPGGQTLGRHVQLHGLIPGGALTEAGDWHPAKSNYLFPVRAWSKHVRGPRVSALRLAANRGELHRITRPGEIDARLDELMSTEWGVYTQAYLSHPDTVVDYLGRYSRQTALHDRRIVGLEDHTVRLRYQDYRDQDRTQVMDLEGEELIRRFLLHSLPPGFMRIRNSRLARQPLPKSQTGTNPRLS